MMSTKRQPVESDVDTDEVPVGEDVRRWPDTTDSGCPSPDFIHRSFISLKPKKPISIAVVFDRALQTDDWLVATTHKDGAKRAGRRELGAQRGAMMDEEGAEEEDSNCTAVCLLPFVKATLGAQQMGAQRGTMMDEEGDGEEEDNKPTAKHLSPFGKADAVAARQRREEPVVVDDGVGGKPSSGYRGEDFSVEL